MMSDWSEFPGALPDEQIFLIGDIHGRHDALGQVLDDIARTPDIGKPRRLVSLGDVIDRGPGSIASLEALHDTPRTCGIDRLTLLPGNHEIFLLWTFDDWAAAPLWLNNGGYAVLDEIGVPHNARIERILAQVEAAIGAERLHHYRTASHAWIGDLLCVHAGLEPAASAAGRAMFLDQPHLPLSAQHWSMIREPFLSHDGFWDEDGRIVVAHGHSKAVRFGATSKAYFAAADQVATRRRINLDAGSEAGEQIGWAELRGGPEPGYRLGFGQLRCTLEMEFK